MIADAATVALAVAGVLFALATVRPRRWLPVWLVGCALWPLAALMVLRAVPSTVGDVQQLATGAATRTTVWDLGLWSPSFLIWGLLWAATALTYARRATHPHRAWPGTDSACLAPRGHADCLYLRAGPFGGGRLRLRRIDDEGRRNDIMSAAMGLVVVAGAVRPPFSIISVTYPSEPRRPSRYGAFFVTTRRAILRP